MHYCSVNLRIIQADQHFLTKITSLYYYYLRFFFIANSKFLKGFFGAKKRRKQEYEKNKKLKEKQLNKETVKMSREVDIINVVAPSPLIFHIYTDAS